MTEDFLMCDLTHVPIYVPPSHTEKASFLQRVCGGRWGCNPLILDSIIAKYQPSRPSSWRPSTATDGQVDAKDPSMYEVPTRLPQKFRPQYSNGFPPHKLKEESPYLFDIQEVSHQTQPNLLIRFWDLSGINLVRDMWTCYLGPANALMFVVDGADSARAAEAGVALLNVLRPSTEAEADGPKA
ncbi:hypothetical protein BJ742DRAFT_854231 [Cladochytrium replicatum]|nr:hypothetical protein BJ742DRAFT_854231 [Cladochytrium replicatum]